MRLWSGFRNSPVMPPNLFGCLNLSVKLCDVAFVCPSWTGDFILHLAGIDDKRVYLEHALEEAERQYQDGDEGDVSLLDRSQQQDSGAEYNARQRLKDVRLLKSSGIRGADDLAAACVTSILTLFMTELWVSTTFCVALSTTLQSIVVLDTSARTSCLCLSLFCPSRAHDNSPCCAGG